MDTSERDGRLIVWFEQWRKPIRSWLRNRASVPPSDIDDLFQDIFIRLMKYSDNIEVANPQGYLFRIAANVANEWRERLRNCRPHDSEWLEPLEIETEHGPVGLIEAEDRQAIIDAAIARLPTRRRLFLQLHTEGMTYKQIAKSHNVTYRIVLRDLTSAYTQLRLELSELNEPHDRRSGRTDPPKAARTQSVPCEPAAVVAQSDVG